MRWYILLALVSLSVLILTEESEGWWGSRRRSSRRRYTAPSSGRRRYSSHRPTYYRRRSYTRRRRAVSQGCGYLHCYNGGTKYCKKGWWTSSKQVSKCRCPSSTTGRQCEKITCPHKTCHNGGTSYCIRRGVTGCKCSSGYSGSNCNDCGYLHCYNGGTKYCGKKGWWSRKKVPKCRCPLWTSGRQCKTMTCLNLCRNGGKYSCIAPGKSSGCTCPPNFSGRYCERGCKKRHCQNGGTSTCVKRLVFFTVPRCLCKLGYYGKYCQKRCPRFRCDHGVVSCTTHLWMFTFSHCVCNRCWEGINCNKRKPCSNWSQSSWTRCNATCGTGFQNRERVCKDHTTVCHRKQEYKKCDTHKHCPIDGQWGEWSTWSPCSQSCGDGFQKSRRQCDKPKPAHGGRKCTGKPLKKRRCNQQNCPPPAYVQIDFKTGGKFPGKSPTIRIFGTKGKWSRQWREPGEFKPGKYRRVRRKLKADLGTLKLIKITNAGNTKRGWKLEEVKVLLAGKAMERYQVCFNKGERVYSKPLIKKLIKGPCPKPHIVVRVTFKTGRKSSGYNPTILIHGTKGEPVMLSFNGTFKSGTSKTVNKTLNADLGTLKSIAVMNTVVIKSTNTTNNRKLKAGNSTIDTSGISSNGRGWDLEMVSVQFVGKKNEVYQTCFKGTPIFNQPIKKNLTKGKISC